MRKRWTWKEIYLNPLKCFDFLNQQRDYSQPNHFQNKNKNIATTTHNNNIARALKEIVKKINDTKISTFEIINPWEHGNMGKSLRKC